MGGSIWNLGLCVNKDQGSSCCGVTGGNIVPFHNGDILIKLIHVLINPLTTNPC